jgi:hypothetical protein
MRVPMVRCATCVDDTLLLFLIITNPAISFRLYAHIVPHCAAMVLDAFLAAHKDVCNTHIEGACASVRLH